MLTIRLDSPDTITDQILFGIRRLIAAGSLKSGDELPTVRQLASDLGINLNTVARAYRLLEETGLVSSVRGRGTVVAATSDTIQGDAAAARERVIGRLRDALAGAKLAGFSRSEIDRQLAELCGEYWKNT